MERLVDKLDAVTLIVARAAAALAKKRAAKAAMNAAQVALDVALDRCRRNIGFDTTHSTDVVTKWYFEELSERSAAIDAFNKADKVAEKAVKIARFVLSDTEETLEV